MTINFLNLLAKTSYSYDYDSGGGGFFAFFLWFLIIAALYVYVSIVLMEIAKKTNTPHAWMAWIPILKNYLLCKIAGKSIIWFILLYLPFINIVAVVVLWMRVAEKRGRPSWWGVLMLLPIVNLAVRGILAFSDVPGAEVEKPKKEKAKAFSMGPKKPKKKHKVLSIGASKVGKFCSKCGVSISKSDKFCSGCGTKL